MSDLLKVCGKVIALGDYGVERKCVWHEGHLGHCTDDEESEPQPTAEEITAITIAAFEAVIMLFLKCDEAHAHTKVKELICNAALVERTRRWEAAKVVRH